MANFYYPEGSVSTFSAVGGSTRRAGVAEEEGVASAFADEEV